MVTNDVILCTVTTDKTVSLQVSARKLGSGPVKRLWRRRPLLPIVDVGQNLDNYGIADEAADQDPQFPDLPNALRRSTVAASCESGAEFVASISLTTWSCISERGLRLGQESCLAKPVMRHGYAKSYRCRIGIGLHFRSHFGRCRRYVSVFDFFEISVE